MKLITSLCTIVVCLLHTKMHKFLLQIFLIMHIVNGERAKIICPTLCSCDFFQNLKRTSCKNHNLAMIEELEIPKQTEVLDVSNNHIRELKDHTFFDMQMTSLKLLNLSQNKISQIHMNTFDGLSKLKTLDLSFNSMQYILPEWFWNLPSLRELYLKKNNLVTLHEGPLLESSTLRVLDLSSCNIPHITDEAFTKLPNLEYLDLSGNFLFQLKPSTIKTLPLLNELHLYNNTLKCNEMMRQLYDYCRKKGITYRDPCLRHNKITSNKFERMINAVPENNEKNEKNNWIYEEDDNKTIIKTVEVCSNKTKRDGLIMEIIELSPLLSLLVPFIIGVLIGLFVACNVQITPSTKINRKNIKRNRSNSRVITWMNTTDTFDQPLMENAIETGQTTPIQQRKTTTHL